MTISNFFVPNRQIIAGITNSYPAVITTTGDNGFFPGLIVRLVLPAGFGMTPLNNQTFLISIISNNSFSINVDTTDFDPFLSGTSAITNITIATNAVITVASNNFSVGQTVFIDDVAGMSEINATQAVILAISGSNLTVNINSTGFTAYAGGGELNPLQSPEIIPVGEEALTLQNAVRNNYTIIPEL